MRILLDTNVVLRLGDKGHVMHGEALAAVDRLDANGHECVIVPQVLYEYWVVATRPTENNGLGMPAADADAAISEWIEVFRLMLDERGIFAYWRDLVATNEVKGKNAHDARLVAAMQRHGLTDLLSFNKPDFARFTTINVFTPTDVLDGRIHSQPAMLSSETGSAIRAVVVRPLRPIAARFARVVSHRLSDETGDCGGAALEQEGLRSGK